MKKLLSILMALMLVFSLSATALAENTGSITINNATVGQTYAGYKVFDAAWNEDLNAVAYSINPGAALYGAVEASNLFTLMPSQSDPNHMVVTPKDTTTDADILAWLQGLNVTNITADLGSTKPTSTTVKWENVPFGYYLITSTLNNKAVTVDNVNKNVNIIDKNQQPGWEDPDDPESPDENTQAGKNVSSNETDYATTNTASIGDTVYFKINAYAPLFNGDKLVTEYTFTDTLDSAFTYNNNMVIKAGNTTLTKDTDYTLTFDTANNTITVHFNVNPKATSGYAWAVDTHLTFTYTAELNANAKNVNPNTVSMTWKECDPDPDDPTTPDKGTSEDPNTPIDPPSNDKPEDSMTETYAYGFKLTKVDSTDSTIVLTGAKFELYDADTAGNKIPVIKINAPAEGAIEGANYYRLLADGETGNDTIEAGKAIIFGLAAGTYYLEETQAPAGYNMLTARQPLTVGKATTTDEGDAVPTTIPAYVDITVENSTGTILPETGGIGTTIFYIVGGILVAGAAVLLITKKRLSKQANN